MKTRCAAEACDQPRRYSNGYCPKHYQRVLRHGTPNPAHIAGSLPTPVSTPEEEWRAIEGHPGYFVSSLGRLFTGIRRAKFLKPVRKKRHGYLSVNLIRPEGGQRTRTVHSLVAEAFLGPRPPGLMALHNDGNHLNNAASNIRWGTHEENMRDLLEHRAAAAAEGKPLTVTRLAS